MGVKDAHSSTPWCVCHFRPLPLRNLGAKVEKRKSETLTVRRSRLKSRIENRSTSRARYSSQLQHIRVWAKSVDCCDLASPDKIAVMHFFYIFEFSAKNRVSTGKSDGHPQRRFTTAIEWAINRLSSGNSGREKLVSNFGYRHLPYIVSLLFKQKETITRLCTRSVRDTLLLADFSLGWLPLIQFYYGSGRPKLQYSPNNTDYR
jgi:hypothetical protein